MKVRAVRQLLIVLLLSPACGDSKTPATHDAAPVVDTSGPHDTAPPDALGETVVPLAGGANALYWDDATSTLYLTDDGDNSFRSWTASAGLSTVTTLPVDPAGSSPGGIIKTGGSFLVADFGFGTNGTLDQITGTTATALTGLAVNYRRIGLATDSSGTIWECYFTGGGGGTQTGGVGTVTVDTGTATETEVAGSTTTAGFKKLVGIAASDTDVFVSDQSGNAIWKIKKADNSVTQLATITKPDLLYMLPDGDLLTGGASTISRITQTGTVSTLTLSATFGTAHGIAYDATGHHLFVIDHSATPGTADMLHVIPFTP